jgi:hypothetical protein
MPEGDTVWLAARRLHDALAGRVLTRTDFRVPQLATVDLTGETVQEVVSRGKHLLTRIGADLTLHTHFKMDGSWHLYRPGAAVAGRPRPPGAGAAREHRVAGRGFRLPSSSCSSAATRATLSGTSVRTCSARTGTSRGGTTAAGCAGPADRRGPARPAQPRRHRQRLQGGGPVPAGSLALGGRSGASATSPGSSAGPSSCSTATAKGPPRSRPGTPGTASTTGSTGVAGSRAGAAARRSWWRGRATRRTSG